VFACCTAGLFIFFCGLVSYWRLLRGVSIVDGLLRFAPVLVAAPLATFSMEHLFDASDIAPLVPAWMPFHVFWTYLVGVALLAAAVSFVARRSMRWSAPSLAVLFVVLILTIHVPNTLAQRSSRIIWTVLLRDSLFGAGVGVLAATLWSRRLGRALPIVQRTGQVIVAVALLVFAVEHFVYPNFAPGIPLPKMTPAWVPLPSLWAYLAGSAFLIAGLGFLANRHMRIAAAIAGGTLLILSAVLYFPILLLEFGSANTVQGINYVGDTMLAAGCVLLCAFERRDVDPTLALTTPRT